MANGNDLIKNVKQGNIFLNRDQKLIYLNVIEIIGKNILVVITIKLHNYKNRDKILVNKLVSEVVEKNLFIYHNLDIDNDVANLVDNRKSIIV